MAYNAAQIDFGQAGGTYLDTTDAYTPPTGKVIVGINVVKVDTSFTLLKQAEDAGSNTFYPSTSVVTGAAGNGVNAAAIASGDNFPVGQWIYGRFSACTLADGAVFLYFAQE
tara:strand:- start:341 stop:676 length:336 start_codon:yes stop_codon:yes gene_type:complete